MAVWLFWSDATFQGSGLLAVRPHDVVLHSCFVPIVLPMCKYPFPLLLSGSQQHSRKTLPVVSDIFLRPCTPRLQKIGWIRSSLADA